MWTNRPELLTWQFRGSVPVAFLTLVLAFEALVWQPRAIAIAIAIAIAPPHAARMPLNIRRLRKPCTAYEARRRALPRRLGLHLQGSGCTRSWARCSGSGA